MRPGVARAWAKRAWAKRSERVTAAVLMRHQVGGVHLLTTCSKRRSPAAQCCQNRRSLIVGALNMLRCLAFPLLPVSAVVMDYFQGKVEQLNEEELLGVIWVVAKKEDVDSILARVGVRHCRGHGCWDFPTRRG